MVKQPWLELILKGQKKWEIRGQQYMKRGVVHLALSGSKSILGRVRIVGCREVLREEFARHHAKHRVPDIRSVPYDKIFAWTMTDPQRFEPPLRCEPHRGAVIWTQL